MAEQQPRFHSALLLVEYVDHPLDPDAGAADEYRSDRHALNFVERGTFDLAMRGRRWTIGPRQIFVTVPGMEYRCREISRPRRALAGRCFDVCFADDAAEAIGRPLQSIDRLAPVVAAGNRQGYLRRRLAAHLDAGSDPLAMDLIGGELLWTTVAGEPARRPYRPSQLDWYARRIDRAREAIDDDCAAMHSLAALARTAGMSPYHFARVFRELVGVPPHRYVTSRRLQAAAVRLRGGDAVTAPGYGAGFGSLSHFIHAFRAAYGASPSRWRALRAASLPAST